MGKWIFLPLLFTLFGSPAGAQTPPHVDEAPRLEPVGGGLKAGDAAPVFESHDLFGHFFSLETALQKGPVVIAFYRGAWEKGAADQLERLQKQVMPLAKTRAFTVVAISTEIPVEGLKLRQSKALEYAQLIDTRAEILKQYKVQDKIPDSEFKKLRERGVDLEMNSAQQHHLVAIPSVYVVNRKAKVVLVRLGSAGSEPEVEGEIVKILTREAPALK